MRHAVRLDFSNFDHSHEPAFRMIENMAVEHPGPWPIVVANDQAHGRLERHIDSIAPGQGAHGFTFLVEDLKEETMKMDGMRPLRLIGHGPDLRFTDRRFYGNKFRHRHVVE